MASPAPKVPFTRVAVDVESDSAELIVDDADNAALRQRPLTKRLVLSAGLVAAVVLVAAASLGRTSDGSTRLPTADAARTIEAAEVSEKFQQCGGEGYSGPKCCEKGCACVIKTQFYSMCATPTNVGSCSFSAAQHEVKLAKARARVASVDINSTAREAEKAEKDVEPTAKAYKKAFAPVPGLRRESDKAKKAYAAVKKHYVKAKAEAEEAAKFADAKAGQFEWTKKTLAPYEKAEEQNRGGQCATINGPCFGQVAPEKACCVIGCICHVQSAYYGQCLPPAGAPMCDEAAARARTAALRENATMLVDIVAKTKKKKEDTAEVFKDAEKKYKELRKVATKAGTARAIAEKLARSKKEKADHAAKKYKDAATAASHAVHNVKYAAAMVKVWSTVASGDSCSHSTAAEIAEADVVDFEAIKEPKKKHFYMYDEKSDKSDDKSSEEASGSRRHFDHSDELDFEDDDDDDGDLGFED